MPEWGAGAWPCPRAQQLSPLPTTRGKGLTGRLACLGAWPRASQPSGPEAAGVAEGGPGQLQRSQHLGAVPVPTGGSSAEGGSPHPCRGLQGSCSWSHRERQGRAPVLFSPAWRSRLSEAHPAWLQRELGRTVAPHPSAHPSLVPTGPIHFFTGSCVLGKLVSIPGAELSPGLCRSRRGPWEASHVFVLPLGIKFNQFLLAFSHGEDEPDDLPSVFLEVSAEIKAQALGGVSGFPIRGGALGLCCRPPGGGGGPLAACPCSAVSQPRPDGVRPAKQKVGQEERSTARTFASQEA